MEDKPSGRLTFLIINAQYGFRARWADGKRQRIETSLNDIVSGLVATAESMRARRLEHERWQEQQREEERRRAEEAERQLLLRQRVADLKSRVADWVTARSIREFAAAMEYDAECRAGAIDAQSELGKWLAWARRYADVVAADAMQTVSQLRPEPSTPQPSPTYSYVPPAPYPFWLVRGRGAVRAGRGALERRGGGRNQRSRFTSRGPAAVHTARRRSRSPIAIDISARRWSATRRQ